MKMRYFMREKRYRFSAVVGFPFVIFVIVDKFNAADVHIIVR